MRYIAALIALGMLFSTATYARQPRAPASLQNQNEASDQQQPQLSQKFIRQIQRHLQQQGAYQGEPSGNWDEQTADALEQFQQEHGLQANGQIDGPTIFALMRPQRLQQGAQDGMEGSTAAPAGPVSGRAIMHAYQHGYQQGYQQGFAAAQEQAQQQE